MKQDFELDHIDRKILRTLSREGRLSNASLGEQVGLSASPCWQRVRRLEEQGYIQGYSAILNQGLLGASETVMIDVILERHDDEVLEEFGREMEKMLEVLEVHLTTGEYDYLIKVAVNGTKGYEAFLREKLYRVRGIRHTRSSFVLRSLKDVQAFVPER